MFKKILTNKGQGALEYLLILGGALLVSVMVIVIITSTRSGAGEGAQEGAESYDALIDQTIVQPIISNTVCSVSDGKIIVYYTPSVTRGVSEYCLVLDGSYDLENCSSDQPAEFDVLLTEGQRYRVSLIAKKGNIFSAPSSPASSCTAE